LTVWTKLCERILLERPLWNDITATDTPDDLQFSGVSQQLEFGPIEYHMLAALLRICVAKFHGKLTHGTNELLPLSK